MLAWASGEPADKAGGYGIQGLGAIFVEKLEGSYSAVVGLGLFETAALLQRNGMTYQRHHHGNQCQTPICAVLPNNARNDQCKAEQIGQHGDESKN